MKGGVVRLDDCPFHATLETPLLPTGDTTRCCWVKMFDTFPTPCGVGDIVLLVSTLSISLPTVLSTRVDRLNSEVLIGSVPLLVAFLLRVSVFKLEVLVSIVVLPDLVLTGLAGFLD